MFLLFGLHAPGHEVYVLRILDCAQKAWEFMILVRSIGLHALGIRVCGLGLCASGYERPCFLFWIARIGA